MNYNNNSLVNYRNRGMTLENDINLSNEYYINKNIAIINKKDTPIKATKINYTKYGKKITSGYFEKKSTTDYNGVYKGYYIDFEAKETNNKTSFPLRNIHHHQIIHIKRIVKHGGISFLIIRFNKLNKTYLLKGIDFLNFIDDKKSIPLNYIEKNGYLIKEGYQPRLDYITIVDQILKEYENEKEINEH